MKLTPESPQPLEQSFPQRILTFCFQHQVPSKSCLTLRSKIALSSPNRILLTYQRRQLSPLDQWASHSSRAACYLYVGHTVPDLISALSTIYVLVHELLCGNLYSYQYLFICSEIFRCQSQLAFSLCFLLNPLWPHCSLNSHCWFQTALCVIFPHV